MGIPTWKQEKSRRPEVGNIQGLTKCTSHIVLSCTKGNTNRKLGMLRKIQPASQGNVAIQRFFVLPIEAIVVSEVGPAIIHADVSTSASVNGTVAPIASHVSPLCARRNL